MTAIVEVREITKRFPGVTAVQGVSFSVQKGEIFGLLGPNGAGKTTILRTAAALIMPDEGEVLVDGRSTRTASQVTKSRVGFLTGNTALYGRLTPRELLQYFGRLHGLAEEQIEARSDELIRFLRIVDFQNRRCEGLSTGQKQRVAIARTLFHDPPVLILDEPTAGLDIIAARLLLSFIRWAREQGKAIIFSTHILPEAEGLCDRIGLLHQGRLLTTGSLDELRLYTGQQDLTRIFLHAVGLDEDADLPLVVETS